MRRTDPVTRRLLLEALRARSEEVARNRASSSAPAVGSAPAGDAEETLRVVMVRLWPALAGDPSAAALDRLADGLESLRDAARTEDWRFLDAWNNAYETIATHDSLVRSARAQALLATYGDLLDHHIRRLAH